MFASFLYRYSLLFEWILLVAGLSACTAVSDHANISDPIPQPLAEIPSAAVNEDTINMNVPSTPSACIEGDHYRLSVFPEKHLIQVNASINIQPGSDSICLPAFGQRFAEKFEIKDVRDPSGRHAFIPFDPFGCVQFLDQPARLSIDYELSISPIDEFHVWMAGSLSPVSALSFMAFPGESLFVEHTDSSHCAHVDVVYPQLERRVRSTLNDTRSPSESRFYAQSAFDLSRSFFVFGDMREIQVAGATNLSISLENDLEAYASLILKDILAIIGLYQTWMPEKLPPNISVFVFENPYDVYHSSGFARPQGIVLQFGREALLNPPERRLLIAHELFHLFNGEQLHFVREDYDQVTWFVEGSTQYLALKAIRSLGLIHEKQYLDILSDMTTQMDEVYQLPADDRIKVQNKPYLDGFFLSWMIDQQWLRYHSNASLNGFWSFLSKNTNWDQPKTRAWLKEKLEEYSQFNFDAFFSLYASGNALIPWRDILAQSGFCVEPYSIQKYDTGFQWTFDPTAAAYRILSVAKNSPADALGIHSGDFFVPKTATNWKTPEDKHIRRMTDDKRIQSFRIPVMPILKNALEVSRCH